MKEQFKRFMDLSTKITIELINSEIISTDHFEIIAVEDEFVVLEGEAIAKYIPYRHIIKIEERQA